MLKGKVVVFTVVAAVVLACAGGDAWAGTPGNFAKTLKNKFCNGTTGSEWYGCYAYMFYRVDYNTGRDTAHSYCKKYGCSKKFDGANESRCFEGCEHAYNSDTR